MTDGERKLWSELRTFKNRYGAHVRRQAPIGPYIPDFVIHDRKLVIEVDGEHHFLPEQAARDVTRDDWLRGQGYKVLRFKTGELDDCFDGCVEEIMREAGII